MKTRHPTLQRSTRKHNEGYQASHPTPTSMPAMNRFLEKVMTPVAEPCMAEFPERWAGVALPILAPDP